MKEIQHAHAKRKRKFTFRKLLLGRVLFWLGGGLISLAFLFMNKLPDWLFGLAFLVFLGWIGFYIYKKVKGYTAPKVMANSPKKAQNALNLSINGKVNIINPYAGVFVCGGAGAGKSKSIIEPLIADAGRKGFTGVIYDFKFPELAGYVASAYSTSDVKPYYINFTDLSRTHRINPIDPRYMVNDSFAREFAYTILANLNPSMISKPDFWSDNSISLLTACFWYLKKHKPEYCTLPHAMSMILQPDLEALLRVLSSDAKCADMIAPILTAYANKADNQLAGVISSLQVSLSKINTEEVYYITTGNDLGLDLNNPMNKSILCIGNNPTLSSTYSPIIGLMLASISKQLNQQGKEKSVFMIDEFPTVYVPNIEQLPATARSNKVATVLVCQDIAQIVDRYGREKTDTILSNLGNQFYGRTTNPQTAQRVSQMFGKADKLMETHSDNFERTLVMGDRRKGSGKSYAYQERDLVKVQDVAKLQTGAFYTVLSEGSIRQGLSSIPMDKGFVKSEIQPIRSVSNFELEGCFEQVKKETKSILGL